MTCAKRRWIVNADDLGFSRAVSEGILQAHREGIVTSATLMTNMPDAPEALDALASVPDLGVGIHLNALQGPVLSRSGRALAGDGATMESSVPALAWRLLRRPGLIRAIKAEFEAQISWALARGLRPTHLDSHRHLHALPGVFSCVADLARRYDVPFLRNCLMPGGGLGPRKFSQQRAWVAPCVHLASRASRVRGAGRGLLACRGVWGLDETTSLDAGSLIRMACDTRPGLWEVMVHPGQAPASGEAPTRLGRSRVRQLEALCDPRVKEHLDRYGIRTTHYGRLAGRPD
jgi:predicted glycoside hydrolase/deacetylase ChbG (UPF0249 family)